MVDSRLDGRLNFSSELDVSAMIVPNNRRHDYRLQGRLNDDRPKWWSEMRAGRTIVVSMVVWYDSRVWNSSRSLGCQIDATSELYGVIAILDVDVYWRKIKIKSNCSYLILIITSVCASFVVGKYIWNVSVQQEFF